MRLTENVTTDLVGIMSVHRCNEASNTNVEEETSHLTYDKYLQQFLKFNPEHAVSKKLGIMLTFEMINFLLHFLYVIFFFIFGAFKKVNSNSLGTVYSD